MVAGQTAKGRTAYHRQKVPGLRWNITMEEICQLVDKLLVASSYPVVDVRLTQEIEGLAWDPKKDNIDPGLLMRAFLLANAVQGDFF